MFKATLETAIEMSLLMSSYLEDFKEWVSENEYSNEARHEFEDSWTANNDDVSSEIYIDSDEKICPDMFKAKIEFSKSNGVFYMFVYKAETTDLIFSVRLDNDMMDVRTVPGNLK